MVFALILIAIIFGVGFGVTFALGSVFAGIGFYLVFGAFIAVLVLGLYASIRFRSVFGGLAAIVMILGAFVPVVFKLVG